MMDKDAVKCAEAYVGAGYPMDAEGLLIVELDGPAVEVDYLVERVSGIARDRRHHGARQPRRAGACAVLGRPQGRVPCRRPDLAGLHAASMARCRAADWSRCWPRCAQMSKKHGLRVVNVFHAGDGNLHPLILFDANDPGELRRAEEFGADILRLCVRVGGVLTGEHGVGIEKRDLMGEQFTEIDLDQQMRVKCAFDPDHLLNPGKVFPKLRRCAELGRAGRAAEQDPVPRHPTVLDDGVCLMGGTIKPRSPEELRQAVEWALNDGVTLDVRGQGSKLALGKPMICDQVLDRFRHSLASSTTPLRNGRHFLRAGTPMRRGRGAAGPAQPDAGLRAARPRPAARPGNGQGTLVGAVMGNLAGPRRLSAGAARDHLLGFSGVNGRGEAFKSGGKVMKNVTGYDLSKLLAGSWGTLAVLDEVSVKVLPAPDQTRTLVLHGLSDEAAVKAMCAAMGSPHEVSGAACIEDRTALRLEGVAPSVEARLKGLRDLLAATGATMEELGTLESRTFWRDVRDVAPLSRTRDTVVWKISCPPTEGPAIVARIKAQRPSVEAFYDWSGGLIWLALPSSADADQRLCAALSGRRAAMPH